MLSLFDYTLVISITVFLHLACNGGLVLTDFSVKLHICLPEIWSNVSSRDFAHEYQSEQSYNKEIKL